MQATESLFSSRNRDHVLGTQSLLARGGDNEDSGDNGSSGSSNSGSSNSGSSDSKSGSSDSDKSEPSKTESSGPSSQGSSGSSKDNSLRFVTPSKQPTPPKVAPDSDDDENNSLRVRQNNEQLDIRLSETERIRTETKDGRTRIDITSGGVKTRLEYRDDRVIIKAEMEDGVEVELTDDTIFKIEQRLGLSGIKIATGSGESFLLNQNDIAAITNFPLSIDLATNTLSVNTPAGLRTLTVLPEEAAQSLIAASIFTRLSPSTLVDQISETQPTTISQVITLTQQDDVPVYEINGLLDQRLLGIIPVAIPKTVVVSVETGEVLNTSQSIPSLILDLVSF